MKRIYLCLLLLASALTAGAQSTFVEKLEQDEPGKGQIRVECDERLDTLVGNLQQAEEGEQIKGVGYRIQVFAGNNTRDARAQAQNAEAYIREYFPELPVYTQFKSPRWLCTVGDFLYYEDAYEVMLMLKKDSQYKGLIILRNQEINVTL